MSDVDMSVLAEMMLEWEKVKARLDELSVLIEDDVLKIGKTQTVGNVRASYSKGRRSFDYEAGAKDHPMVSDSTVKLFTVVPETPLPYVDWRGICKHAGIDDVPFTQGDPSVTVKLV